MSTRLPLPKEHGSWVMFLVAWLAGTLAAGRFSPAVLLYLVAALAAFILRRPLAMRLRGEPCAAAGRAAVARWTLIYAAAGLGAAAPLLAVYRLWFLLPIGLVAALLLGVDLRRSTQTVRPTFGSELAGATGIPLVAVGAYYAATGQLAPMSLVLGLWAALAFHFVSGVFYVRMKVRWVKRPPVTGRVRWETGWENLLYHLLMPVAAAALSAAGGMPRYTWLALLPAALRRLWGTAAGRRETDFRALGRNEAVFATVFLVLLLITFRWN